MRKINLRNYPDIAADMVDAGYTSEKVADLVIRGGLGNWFTCDRAFYLLLKEMDRIQKGGK